MAAEDISREFLLSRGRVRRRIEQHKVDFFPVFELFQSAPRFPRTCSRFIPFETKIDFTEVTVLSTFTVLPSASILPEGDILQISPPELHPTAAFASQSPPPLEGQSSSVSALVKDQLHLLVTLPLNPISWPTPPRNSFHCFLFEAPLLRKTTESLFL